MNLLHKLSIATLSLILGLTSFAHNASAQDRAPSSSKAAWQQKALRGSRSPSVETVRLAQHQAPVTSLPSDDSSDIEYEPLAEDGHFADSGNYGCDDGSCNECEECNVCCPWLYLGPRTFSVFGGVHGYKGPRDLGRNGNFGFQQGVNFGAPLGDPWGCGYQLGFQALQSNFYGDQVNPNNENNFIRTGDRHQYFFTGGIFRRADCCGWQWAMAFDLLHDTFYGKADLKQLRTETGYLLNESNEIGYSGAYGVGGDDPGGSWSMFGRQIDGMMDPTDQFMVYYRRYFENGGDGRIWAGVTGNGDGLFGADTWVPLGGSLAIQSTFNFLIPKEGRGEAGGQINESWGLAMNLVWYPGRSSQCVGKSCYRPILNVADNSLFMVNQNFK